MCKNNEDFFSLYMLEEVALWASCLWTIKKQVLQITIFIFHFLLRCKRIVRNIETKIKYIIKYVYNTKKNCSVNSFNMVFAKTFPCVFYYLSAQRILLLPVRNTENDILIHNAFMQNQLFPFVQLTGFQGKFSCDYLHCMFIYSFHQ